ncbi:MAG: class I SAM-dependent methyltransferase [Acidobacteriaceae bacterium]|nr:class I SAM-dependent methyltransferase [Acidobacteriaceae bacterium]
MTPRLLRCVVPLVSVVLLSTSAAYARQSRVDNYKNNLAPYVGSPERAIEKMLDMANLKPGETLYDLGCGDGRILIAAAKKYRAKAVGIEISPRLAKLAAEEVKKAGVQDGVRVVHGDFMQTNLSPANVVTLYLATTANESLRPNLERYLKPSTRVVSYDYPIPGWKPKDTSETEGRFGATHTIYLYEVPDSLKK